MVAPAERAFPFFPRGEIRTQILESWRYHLRNSIDPTTGAAFTEADIQAATAVGSGYWDEADAIDLVLLAQQQRGLWLADQSHPRTASDEWLRTRWGKLWSKTKLPATAGGGPCTAAAAAGTIFIGSTTLPSPAAHKFRIGAVTYQVLYTTSPTPSSGVQDLVVRALETGVETNAPAGSIATWVTPPAGVVPNGITITEDFQGGFAAETAAEFALRIESAIRHREGAGNQPDFRGWARDATNGVEDAWIYCAALEAGSVVVAITQKRGSNTGPSGRTASSLVVSDVTAYLVPPGSPVVPAGPFVLVVATVDEPSDVAVALQMPSGSTLGWVDVNPWPQNTTQLARISTVTDQTHIQITTGDASALPSSTPSLMVWNVGTSRFEILAVSSVTLSAGTVYDVVLSSSPVTTLAVGLAISPGASRHATIAGAAEDFFDSLGPGEVVDLSTSTLAADAYRWPSPDEEWPQRVGTGLLTYIRDALGGASTDQDLIAVSVPIPTVPTDPSAGPNRLTLGDFGVYPL